MNAPQPPASPAAAAAPKYLLPTRRSVLLMLIVALAGIALILRAWQLPPFDSGWVSTDDAYVRGQVTVLAPQTSGYVSQILVSDFARVRQGQPLLQIDDRSYRRKVEQAQAELDQARAQLANSAQSQAQDQAQIALARANLRAVQAEQQRAHNEASRYDQLASQQLVSLNDRERMRSSEQAADAGVAQSRASVRIAEQGLASTQVARTGLAARVATAEAALKLALLDLENTVVRAPRDGQLSEVTVRQGQYVSAGSQLLFLVPDSLWVVANIKEGRSGNLAIGQPVRLQVDALGGQPLHGHVEQIAPATGSEFALLKADNASGNFTKVVQRLPVRIAIDPGQARATRLRPGMSVVVQVDTRASATPGLQASVD